jgi:hypothetical protein
MLYCNKRASLVLAKTSFVVVIWLTFLLAQSRKNSLQVLSHFSIAL